MRCVLLVLGLLAASAAIGTASAQVNERTPGYFPFFIPPLDDSESFVDMSFLNSKPAGAAGPVTVQGSHFVDGNGRPIRFLGGNLVYSACFPDKARAAQIAGHLAKLGVNVMRMHYIDSSPPPGGLMPQGRSDFDPEQLDRLDWLIHQLKQHGIYTNLNLHVGRHYPGLPRGIPYSFRSGKKLDNFYPPFIDLQKDFARRLLTHRNPYTGATYAEEPAIACVEINNENPLTAIMPNDVKTMPEPFRSEFERQLRKWLTARHGPVEASDERVSRSMAGMAEHDEDFWEFLSETECLYAADMIRFLRHDLGVRAPVSFTQANFGDILGAVREAKVSDFVDVHAYWQHPRFPAGKPWDPVNWTIENTSLVAHPESAKLINRAWFRAIDQPLTISEYNHPVPSDYAVELFPVLASFAAFQDWDGIYVFAWSSSREGYDRPLLKSFFDVHNNPGHVAFMPIAALMFRMAGVAAGGDPLVATIPTGDLARRVAKDGRGFARAKRMSAAALVRPTGFRLSTETGPVRLPDFTVRERTRVSNTNQLVWDTTDPKTAALTINAPAVRAAIGYIGGREIALGDAVIKVTRAANNWAAVAVGALDGKPLSGSSRVLIVVVGRIENSNMQWNGDRTSVGRQWGGAPIVCEGIEATIRLPVRLDVHALDETGKPKQKLDTAPVDGGTEFRIVPDRRTLWFGAAPK